MVRMLRGFPLTILFRQMIHQVQHISAMRQINLG